MHSVSDVCTGIGSTTLPCVSIYSPAGSGFIIRELAVWNTTATACVYKWARLTTTATPGSGLTEMEWDESGAPPLATVFGPHTSTGPTITNTVEYMPIGAAIGAGYYYTYGGRGLVVAPAATNGIGLVLAVGTGQILAYKIVWEED